MTVGSGDHPGRCAQIIASVARLGLSIVRKVRGCQLMGQYNRGKEPPGLPQRVLPPRALHAYYRASVLQLTVGVERS